MEENLQHAIEELYGIELSDAMQTHRGAVFGLKTSPDRRFLLREAGNAPQRIIFTYVAQRYLYEHGFPETDLYLPDACGRPYVLLGGGVYVASPVCMGRECSIESRADLERAASVLARMHLASVGFTPGVAGALCARCAPPELLEDSGARMLRVDAGKMPALFAHRTAELERFLRMSRKSANRFDCAFAEIATVGIRHAQAVCERLQNGRYARAQERCLRDGALCHKDYTAHNVLHGAQHVTVLNFDQCAIDLPVCDVANLIKRRMRKCGWNVSDALRIVQAYSRLRPFYPEEPELLCLLLAFPQKLWRVVNKYYNSKRAWCEKSCLAKLDEIRAEQGALDPFLRELAAAL